MRENETYKLIPYLLYDIPYALPTNASPALRRHMHLALAAYLHEDLDFEHVSDYREDIDELDFSLDEGTQRDFCVDIVMTTIVQLTELLTALAPHCSEFYSLRYGNAMGRLRASFESCIILLRNGYYIESVPILRLILEQIAWAYAILGKERQEIEQMKVTKQIAHLNDLIPDSNKLNGPYSQQAHLDPQTIGSYTEIDEELGRVGYRYRSGSRSKEKYYDLFVLAQLYIRSLYKFAERQKVLDLDTELQTPDKQLVFSVRERLAGAEQGLVIAWNHLCKIDGKDYDATLPKLSIVESALL
ncbi:hypothetical protein B5M42_000255 [Paenibacillus athensensis]|nr:hypothetical protein [Paenibacillus athensensis]MCD1257266.1 hypothetical protein [Paenibacillus athensensis]